MTEQERFEAKVLARILEGMDKPLTAGVMALTDLAVACFRAGFDAGVSAAQTAERSTP